MPHNAPSKSHRQAPQIQNLGLEAQLGQLMMVGFSGTELTAAIRASLQGFSAGGVCLFKGNIASPRQLIQLNSAIRSAYADGVPPFIAVDQEGGNVVRVLNGAVVLPGNMALGATRSRRLTYEAGKAQGASLRALGFNMNFAPVLDVNLNPRNPVIGVRAFGDNPELVSQLGWDFVRGQQSSNLITVAKHFPGHGDTELDSHLALPISGSSEAGLRRQLQPFRRVIQGGLDGLMTAHVAVPALTGKGSPLPATLSTEVLTRLLRKGLHFGGLVITDELEMDSIAARYGVGRAAVMAIKAGADMVLVPWHEEKKVQVQRALLEALRSGEISRARLGQSVRRILEVKERRGLFDAQPSEQEQLSALDRPTPSAVATQIARRAVTLLRADPRTFPIPSGTRVAVITAGGALARAIRKRLPNSKVLVVPAYPKPKQRPGFIESALALAAQSSLVVVGVINSQQLELVRAAASSGKPVVAVTMGLPYLAEQLTEASTVLSLYSYRQSAAEAGAAALFGERGTPGRLPVTLPSYPYGYGLDPVGTALLSEAPHRSSTKKLR